jgi:hypothetical protein
VPITYIAPSAPIYRQDANVVRICPPKCGSATGACQRPLTIVLNSQTRYIHTNAGGCTFARIVGTSHLEEDCDQVRNLYTRGWINLDQTVPNAIVKLKEEYGRSRRGRTFLSEIVPIAFTKELPIGSHILHSLHDFANSNDMYVGSIEQDVASIPCYVYEADINRYWLSSRKYDSSYQPFYPTWLMSAYALAQGARSLGFSELVDIGSGDGRIAYCGNLVGMRSFGIEIDADLVQLQKKIASATGASYTALDADATRFDYRCLQLSRPMFFISGLPEMGEMLARSVLEKVIGDPELGIHSGFNFMGSHVHKTLSKDHTGWGWGQIIEEFDLQVNGVFTLPTYWTTEQAIDTAYVYATAPKPQHRKESFALELED